MTVRTRFAPSPTGKLHIGGARTALFCFLFARNQGGEFLLRVEDTDKERSTPENVDIVLDAMQWLGLDHDGDIVFQSANIEAHKAAVEQLLASGAAYEDEGAVRFKVPAADVTYTDLIQGEITTPHTSPSLKDFVIQRSDGTPTYNLAVVCDDHAMQVTHVLRGDDHINNTPKQILLYQALGWDVPAFGHVPLVLGEDGKKLSKRHGAASVQEFASQGYLPLAVNNQLMRLGWAPSHDDLLTLAEAAQEFSLDKLSKSAAVFDYARLNSYNHKALNSINISEIINKLKPIYNELAHTPSADELARVKAGLPALLERADTLQELAQQSLFYFDNGFSPDEKAAAALSDGSQVLQDLASKLSAQDTWEEAALQSVFEAYLAETNQGFKALGLPMRAALIGRTGGPGVAQVAAALGKAETLRRLEIAAQHN